MQLRSGASAAHGRRPSRSQVGYTFFLLGTCVGLVKTQQKENIHQEF